MSYDHARLNFVRERQGLTKTELAGRIGLNVMTVIRCLNGETAHPPTVKKIADALGVDMADVTLQDSGSISGEDH